MRVIVNVQTGQVTQDANFTPTDFTAATVPAEISKVQFVRAMRQMDIWDSYKALVEADPDWPYITEMPRANAALNASANAALGEQTAQALLDQIFTLGATL